MKKMLQASLKWSQRRDLYMKNESLSKIFYANVLCNGRRYFVLVKNKNQARDKVRDYLNNDKEFNIPYLVPYTAKDIEVFNMREFEEAMRFEISQGTGCGIESI